MYLGTLVKVDREANLLWGVNDTKEGIVVMIPGYEEEGILVLVCGGLQIYFRIFNRSSFGCGAY